MSYWSKVLVIKVAIFSDVTLVSNYHGCKEGVANKLNTTLFERLFTEL